MANKKIRIEIATISAAAYCNGKKNSNTFNWRVFTIDEKNAKELFEKERVKVEKQLREQYHSQYPQDDNEIFAKITKLESHYVDSYTSHDVSKIGTSGNAEVSLEIQK